MGIDRTAKRCAALRCVVAVKRPAKRRQRAPRPASPYSTDSNYSAVQAPVPHRPYPKSERRKQLANNGRQGRHRQPASVPGNAVGFSSPSNAATRPLPCTYYDCGLVAWDV